jgi:ElaB/YqjD/DUF883 family membrane-anchored ribosome-binding protein
VDSELEMIHHQMEQKRASLAEKLDALENQVIERVQDTTKEVTDVVHEVTEGVSGVVQEVKSTVGAVVQNVKSTVDSVKEGVHETVESVKETIDIREYIRHRPWMWLAGSFAAGVAGGYFMPSSRTVREWTWQPHPAPTSPSVPNSLSDLTAPWEEPVAYRPQAETYREPARESRESMTDQMMAALGDAGSHALGKVKELAIGTLMGVLSQMLTNNLPAALKPEVSNLMTDLTTRLGGKVLDFSESFEQSEEATGHADRR